MPRLKWFHIDRRGSIAVETAIIVPVLFLLTMGTVDLTKGIIAKQEVRTSPLTIAQIASFRAATGTTAPYNKLISSDGYAASTVVYAQLPDLLTATPPPFGVVISSIIMTAVSPSCTSNCGTNGYTAHVAWSGDFVGTLGTTMHRPCDITVGQPVLAAGGSDQDNPSPTTLPPDAYSPVPILVVDVYYTYYPVFTTAYAPLHANVNFAETDYFAPRTGPANSQSWFHYFDNGSSPHPNVDICPVDPSWPP